MDIRTERRKCMVINMNERMKEDFDVINDNWKKKV